MVVPLDPILKHSVRFFEKALFLMSLSVVIPVQVQDNPKTLTCQKTKQADLELAIDYPPEWKQTGKRPAIVFFFGGGGENGNIKAFERQAARQCCSPFSN